MCGTYSSQSLTPFLLEGTSSDDQTPRPMVPSCGVLQEGNVFVADRSLVRPRSFVVRRPSESEVDNIGFSPLRVGGVVAPCMPGFRVSQHTIIIL